MQIKISPECQGKVAVRREALDSLSAAERSGESWGPISRESPPWTQGGAGSRPLRWPGSRSDVSQSSPRSPPTRWVHSEILGPLPRKPRWHGRSTDSRNSWKPSVNRAPRFHRSPHSVRVPVPAGQRVPSPGLGLAGASLLIFECLCKGICVRRRPSFMHNDLSVCLDIIHRDGPSARRQILICELASIEMFV